MMNETPTEQRNGYSPEQITKVILTLVFLGGLGVFILASGPTRLARTIETWVLSDFLLLGLATTRLGRMVAFDRVMEPMRAAFTQTVPDLSGAGDTVIARGQGVRRALGQLISCPICIGTWIAAGMVALLVWFPGPMRLFLWMIASVALAEVLHALIETLTWTGQLNRMETGTHCLTREQARHNAERMKAGK